MKAAALEYARAAQRHAVTTLRGLSCGRRRPGSTKIAWFPQGHLSNVTVTRRGRSWNVRLTNSDDQDSTSYTLRVVTQGSRYFVCGQTG